MNIKMALREGTARLVNSAASDTPRLDCELVLAKILGKDRLYLAVHPQEILTPECEAAFFSCVARREKHEPTAYITGEREFMSLPFFVQPGVLIPRPDTETLVEYVLERIQKPAPKVLDLCTGSGAIAVSIAKYIKNAEVSAVDISPVCVQTAEKNAARNRVDARVRILQADILTQSDFGGGYDCIVSNPPYIAENELPGLMPDVRLYEPQEALAAGQDGLLFYRRILSFAHNQLLPGGLLALEAGHTQAAAIQTIMSEAGHYTAVETVKDLAGIERVIACRRRG